MNKTKESIALTRVWEWKEEIYNDVKSLTLDEMINKVKSMSEEVGKDWEKNKALVGPAHN
jgi:hypothetical protein